jgi:hypothetical protein
MGLFDVGGKFKPRNVAGVQSSRFIEPHDCEEIAEWRVKYANADKLAKEIGPLPENFRAIVILDGKFIMGDFIEALIVRNNWLCEELTISTLSMSQENVDSFQNLVKGGYLKSLNLIVSHYYFATERGKLMPYLYDKLDVERDGYEFQMAVASVHTKIALIRTTCGKKISIHGSANMRTSSNIEQIVVENNAEVFDFFSEIHHGIIKAHATIDKAVRRTALWSAVLGDEAWQQEAAERGKSPDSPPTTKREQRRKDATPSAARKAGI